MGFVAAVQVLPAERFKDRYDTCFCTPMLWVSAYTASSCCEGVNNENGKRVRRHVEAASGELLRVIGSRVWLVVRAHGLPVEAGSLSWGEFREGEK